LQPNLKSIALPLACIVALSSLFILSYSQTKPVPNAIRQDSSEPERFALRLKATFAGHKHQITGIDFSPDGRFLVTSSNREETSELWNTATGQLIAELDGTIDLKGFQVFDRQDAHVFSPDGRILVTVHGQETKLRDAANGHSKFTLAGHERDICSVAFSPDSERLATGSEDGTVRLWNTSTGKLITSLSVWRVKKLPRWRIVSRFLDISITIFLSFSPDGRKLLTAVDWETAPAKLWDTESGRLLATLGGHIEHWQTGSKPAPIHKAMFSADGQFIATESFNETRLWEAKTGLLKNTFSSFQDSAKFSRDGKLLGVLKKDDNIGLFDVETGEMRIPLTRAQMFADQIVFSSDGQTVAVDETIVDVPGRRVRATIPFVYKRGRFILEPEDYVTDLDLLSFHPNSRVLMAANHEFVRFWDVITGQLIMKKGDARTPAAFSPDGRLLVTTGTDKKTAMLWEVIAR
jgi:WD40 repeat protein